MKKLYSVTDFVMFTLHFDKKRVYDANKFNYYIRKNHITIIIDYWTYVGIFRLLSKTINTTCPIADDLRERK